MGAVLDLLRSDDRTGEWLQALEGLAGADRLDRVDLPRPDDLAAVLVDLAIPHEDINELIALRSTVLEDPDWRWLLAHGVRGLVRDIGAVGGGIRVPLLPSRLATMGRYFPVFAFVAALPHVRAYHQEHAVPDDISRRTLADLGRHMALYRRRFGTGGLLVPFWIQLHFRGEIYQLGRLQFQRATLGQDTGTAVEAAGLKTGPGGPELEVHIPDFSGPLTPAACDASLARAREFFPRHFPTESYQVAGCYSWLLDPQLAEYLPAESNILRFQRRFRLVEQAAEPHDTVPVGFVFGDPDLAVDTLPRRTSVERAIGDHLRAGRHWYGGRGWFAL